LLKDKPFIPITPCVLAEIAPVLPVEALEVGFSEASGSVG
jgi:hypothetical protein